MNPDQAITNLIAASAAIVRETPDYKNGVVTESVLEQAAHTALNALAPILGIPPEILSSVSPGDLTQRLGMQFIVIDGGGYSHLETDAEDHLPWLPQLRSNIFPETHFWDNYRKLLQSKNLPENVISELDRITDSVLGDLENPKREGEWDRRGLVMGQVQSGKTANYSGLVAKAADAGYKIIIVLAGTYNNLRSQTQIRLDEAFTGLNSRYGLTAGRAVGVGRGPHQPVIALTSSEDAGDFRRATAEGIGYQFGSIQHPTLLVIKKNVSIMKNLYNWMEAVSQTTDGKITNVPLLLIDDEADSASINTVNPFKDTGLDSEEIDPTATNMWIRKILNLFAQSSFVGYTATPFANIFIDSYADHPEFGEDLFPRSFIYAIDPPTNHIGPEKIFGIGANADGESEVLPLLNEVNDAERWIPTRHRSSAAFKPEEFPESLRRAILSFILSCAARRHRGQEKDFMSMLIHVTPWIATQNQVYEQVASKFLKIRNQILYNDSLSNELKEIWDTDFLPAAHALQEKLVDGNPPIQAFEEIESRIEEATAAIEIKQINGSSTDVLDYERLRGEGTTWIVIGGAKLSRGLTLEGLSVSYYLRSTRMYDTLLQMGRWFGYRPGYADLCRIYTSEEIESAFRNIAIASHELLVDFKEMQRLGKTPEDFKLKVRTSPGLLVTAQSKMRHSTVQQVSYSMSNANTRIFKEQERSTCIENLEKLLQDIDDASCTYEHSAQNSHSWSKVPVSLVEGYFRDLSRQALYSEVNGDANPLHLHDYIKGSKELGYLTDWTILLKTNTQKGATKYNLSGLDIGLNNRSHDSTFTAGIEKGLYRVKTLVTSLDEGFDLTDAQVQQAKNSWEELGTGKIMPARSYRNQRDPSKGLLIFYLLDPKTLDEYKPNFELETPFVSYSVSFPRELIPRSVSYVVNNRYEQQQMEL
jgi:hypothetical protein